MATAWGDPSPVADLEKLAAELDAQAYATCLVTLPGGRTRLHVTNRAATSLTEAICSDGRHYYWGWAERIAATDDVADAAAEIAKVLRAAGDGR